MEEEFTKEIVQELMGLKGESRGAALKADGEFILKEKGEEGLKRLEEKMAEVGCPIDYEKVKPMDFLPLGIRAVELLAIKELFGFDREEFQKMGIFGTKLSLIIKAFLKYFGSVKMLAGQSPRMWRKYYTTGDLEVAELDEEKKYVILKLKNFRLHPLHCQLLEGYFSNVVKMAVGAPVICEETKCTFRGDEYHEYLAKW